MVKYTSFPPMDFCGLVKEYLEIDIESVISKCF